MSLRPRYSLLTLLVLTALVAGGVKLWYGPHHVVVRVSPTQEEEYTYTRDWRGNKLQQGPYVTRIFDRRGKLEHVEIYFLHDGKNVYYRDNQMAMCYTITKRPNYEPGFFYKKIVPEIPLVGRDLQAFQETIEREKTRFRASNPESMIQAGYWPEVMPVKD